MRKTANAQAFDDRIDALRRLVDDTSVRLNLSQGRFRARIDAYVCMLVAQRAGDPSRQNLIGAEPNRAGP